MPRGTVGNLIDLKLDPFDLERIHNQFHPKPDAASPAQLFRDDSNGIDRIRVPVAL